jgi:enamine deaminase RidA (YjgF/YER057c/UK114 family)
MTASRTPIVPASMQPVVEQKGYLPGLRVGDIVFLAGQVGRTLDMQVVAEPRAQFEAAFENLRLVLVEAGCTFVDMGRHWPVFREVKNRVLPRGRFPWTAIGVSALADPAFLLEVKATACVRG